MLTSLASMADSLSGDVADTLLAAVVLTFVLDGAKTLLFHALHVT